MKRILNKKYNLDNGIIRYFLLIIIALLVIAIFLTIFCCSNNEGNTSWWCSHLATTIIFITAITALLVQKSLKRIYKDYCSHLADDCINRCVCRYMQQPAKSFTLCNECYDVCAGVIIFHTGEEENSEVYRIVFVHYMLFCVAKSILEQVALLWLYPLFHITDFHKNTNKVVCLDCIYNNYVRYRYLVFTSRFFIGKKIHSRKKHRHDS